MLDWILSNWQTLAAVICAIERILAMKGQMGKRIGILMSAIQQQHNLTSGDIKTSAKALIPDKFKGDVILDTVLDTLIEPRANTNGSPKRRVSKKRRAGIGLLQFLPIVSRILDR